MRWIVPVPATGVGRTSVDQHAGQIGRGGWCQRPHAPHRASASRCASRARKYGAVSRSIGVPRKRASRVSSSTGSAAGLVAGMGRYYTL